MDPKAANKMTLGEFFDIEEAKMLVDMQEQLKLEDKVKSIYDALIERMK